MVNKLLTYLLTYLAYDISTVSLLILRLFCATLSLRQNDCIIFDSEVHERCNTLPEGVVERGEYFRYGCRRISYKLRGGEIGYESQKTNRVYVAICEGCGRRGRVTSDVETGRNWIVIRG